MVTLLTSAELHSRYRNGKDVGEPMDFGSALNQASNSATETQILQVPDDKVFLMTQVVMQSDDISGTLLLNGSGSPGNTATLGMNIGSPGSANDTLGFLAFRRWQSLFDTAGTPSWRNAPPANPVVWKPKYPIEIPPGWAVSSGATGGEYGNFAGCYGYLVDRDQAVALGYCATPSETGRRAAVTVAAPTASFADVVAASAGRAIRIKDIHIRMQSDVDSANTLTIRQSDGSRDILRITNKNPSEPLEESFSPDIYLKDGAALQAAVTIPGTASINISYEYVLADQVPMNHWWACLTPILPTPGFGTGSGLGAASTFSNTQLVPYYPGRDNASEVVPKGHQLMVRGYLLNAQKDNTVAAEKITFALSGGNAGGSIYNPLLSWDAQSNVQISPTFILGLHDQMLTVVVEDINVPVKGDTGSPGASGAPGGLWVDARCLGVLGATPSTGGNLVGWNVCAWGIVTTQRRAHMANEGA